VAEAESKPKSMTAQQYLLSQAEFCRRAAMENADPFVVAELCRLAELFELKAQSLDDWPLENASLQKYALGAAKERTY
jgi:hypothetical protein